MQPGTKIIALFIVAVLCFNCLAENFPSRPDIDVPITLQDYLRLAALNNADLKK